VLIVRIVLVGVAGALAAPLFFPFVTAIGQPGAVAVLCEFSRQATLLATTAQLVALSLALAMPTGIALAIIWCGTDAAGRRLGRAATFACLAVPLPVLAVAWQAAGGGVWNTFRQGLLPAAGIHAISALPWVALLVGAALHVADRAIADEAQLSGSAADSLAVAVRLSASGVILAALWIATQTAGEIVVTDVAMVRTFAEEVYSQFVGPAPDAGASAELALARAVLAVAPQTALFAGALLGLGMSARVHRWNDRPEPAVWLMLGSRRRLVSLAGWMATLALIVVPVAALSRRAGAGPADTWSAKALAGTLQLALRNDATGIVWTLATAMVTGIGIATAVAAVCLWARSSRGILSCMFLLAAIAVATPGPVVGVGLKQAVDLLVGWEERLIGPGWVRAALYDGPSLAPVIWAWSVRAWPIALAVLWPVAVRLPDDFADAVRLDSGAACAVARHGAWPALAPAGAVAAGLAAAFSLQEVSASKLAATPGGATFAHDLFSRMHYGLTPDLAAACLLLVAACLISGLAFVALRKLISRTQ